MIEADSNVLKPILGIDFLFRYVIEYQGLVVS